MEFNLTTFIIEILNFIILVWILKRLLYQPVKNIINQRKESIQKTIEEAQRVKTEAKKLESKYCHRLNDWEKEKEQERNLLFHEINQLRKKELEKLKETLSKEKEKNKAIQEHKIKQTIEQGLSQSLALASSFMKNLLQKFANQDLQGQIINLFIDELSNIDDEQLQILQSELTHKDKIYINTAFKLSKQQQDLISNKLQSIFTEQKIKFIFDEQLDLLAGINVQIGAISLQANLRDELKFFTEVTRGSLFE